MGLKTLEKNSGKQGFGNEVKFSRHSKQHKQYFMRVRMGFNFWCYLPSDF